MGYCSQDPQPHFCLSPSLPPTCCCLCRNRWWAVISFPSLLNFLLTETRLVKILLALAVCCSSLIRAVHLGGSPVCTPSLSREFSEVNACPFWSCPHQLLLASWGGRTAWLPTLVPLLPSDPQQCYLRGPASHPDVCYHPQTKTPVGDSCSGRHVGDSCSGR